MGIHILNRDEGLGVSREQGNISCRDPTGIKFPHEPARFFFVLAGSR